MRTTARLVVVVTVVTGAIGALRHRHERQVARAGLTPPTPAATVTAAPPGEDPLSRALAGWIPRRPTTPAGRVAAAVWAAPVTAVGVLAGALSGGSWQWHDEHGCFVVSGGKDLLAILQSRLGFAGNALGHVVLTARADPSPTLLAHEAVHVRQAERLGVGLAPLYAILWARWGYRNHPLERAARRAAAAVSEL